jgi:hypothetical protein
MPAFSLQNMLAERGFRPQAPIYITLILQKIKLVDFCPYSHLAYTKITHVTGLFLCFLILLKYSNTPPGKEFFKCFVTHRVVFVCVLAYKSRRVLDCYRFAFGIITSD